MGWSSAIHVAWALVEALKECHGRPAAPGNSESKTKDLCFNDLEEGAVASVSPEEGAVALVML